MPKNVINWFEIPVVVMPRAMRFYEQVLGSTLKRELFAGIDIAVFSGEDGAVKGALRVARQGGVPHKPSPDGAILYLDASGQMESALGRVVSAGGEVVLGKTAIGPAGFMALVRDTEGNVIGLHDAP
jgi:predicted enzyme related to lactoylglutathione lyase